MNDKPASNNVPCVAVIGTGVIGASWAALFLAAGFRVKSFDAMDVEGKELKARIDQSLPTLRQLGMHKGGLSQLVICGSAVEAVSQVDFVQESIPENLSLKHRLYQEIEPALSNHTIVASSASGLLVRDMQQGWQDPSRFILAHPFNPPHLIPLVELLANEHTAVGVLEAAETFYKNAGKITIRVNKEVPAHVANRLQAALWREAISLVENGVASVEDVDKAVWAGPGVRWAAMGPHMLFNLGAGSGGLADFCERYADSFHHWWDDMGTATLTEATVGALVNGVSQEAQGKSQAALAEERDALIAGFLNARSALQKAD